MIKKNLSIILLATTSLLAANNVNDTTEQIKPDQTANVETNIIETVSNCPIVEDQFFDNYTTEFFKITNVENGIIRGELVNGSGEGIYYNLIEGKEELEKHKALWNLEEGDIISISWSNENYNNEEWLDIYKVVLVKSAEELKALEGAKQ